MSFEKYRTNDAPITGRVSYLVNLPASLWYIREVADALRTMTDEDNWEENGTVTIHEATQEAIRVLKGFHPMIGQIIPYCTADPPDNCLICDGSVYERTAYPDLYAILSSAFIIDADHFSVPDLRGKTIIGVATAYAMGSTGGEAEHQLTGDEMPAHSHTDTGHQHTTGNSLSSLAVMPGEGPVLVPNPIPALTGSASANITNTGGSEAHNNMQPYVALMYAVVAL